MLNQPHLELIEGELIDKVGKNSPHFLAVALVAMWLRKVFGELFVLTEVPIDVAPEDNHTSEPEPDIIVFDRPLVDFLAGNARPRDLHLLVEVSDATLVFDLSVKAALYARAAIVEYWVLDVNRRRLIVHRDPAQGKYASVSVYSENEGVSPLAAPDSEFRAIFAFPA